MSMKHNISHIIDYLKILNYKKLFLALAGIVFLLSTGWVGLHNIRIPVDELGLLSMDWIPDGQKIESEMITGYYLSPIEKSNYKKSWLTGDTAAASEPFDIAEIARDPFLKAGFLCKVNVVDSRDIALQRKYESILDALQCVSTVHLRIEEVFCNSWVEPLQEDIAIAAFSLNSDADSPYGAFLNPGDCFYVVLVPTDVWFQTAISEDAIAVGEWMTSSQVEYVIPVSEYYRWPILDGDVFIPNQSDIEDQKIEGGNYQCYRSEQDFSALLHELFVNR